MNKVSFYRLDESINPIIVGKTSGDLNRQISEFIDPENTDVERMNLYQSFPDEYHPETLDFTKFKTNDNAKITDLMSSLFLPQAFFISLRFWKILEKSVLENIKFFDASFHHKGKKYYYKVLNYKESTNLIDYSKSSFCIENKFTRELINENIKQPTINSYDDYINESRNLYKSQGLDYHILPKTIILKQHIDACSFYFNANLYISENLKEELVKENITGIELQEINSIEFFIDN